MNANENSHTLRDYILSTPAIEYRKEEIIIFPDREPDGFYLIESGYVKAYTMSGSGEQYLRITYKDGEYFPLLWAFKDTYPRLYYQAQSSTVVHKIPREELYERMMANGNVAIEMLAMVIDIYDLFANRLANLEIDSAYKRIVFRLVAIAERYGVAKGDEVAVQVQFSHQDFAFSLNIARETVSRQLLKLKEMGLISYRSRYITIHDLARLKDELD